MGQLRIVRVRRKSAESQAAQVAIAILSHDTMFHARAGYATIVKVVSDFQRHSNIAYRSENATPLTFGVSRYRRRMYVIANL